MIWVWARSICSPPTVLKQKAPEQSGAFCYWAELLLRVFAVDVFACPKFDGRVQRIAFITPPRVISAILGCAGCKQEPP